MRERKTIDSIKHSSLIIITHFQYCKIPLVLRNISINMHQMISGIIQSTRNNLASLLTHFERDMSHISLLLFPHTVFIKVFCCSKGCWSKDCANDNHLTSVSSMQRQRRHLWFGIVSNEPADSTALEKHLWHLCPQRWPVSSPVYALQWAIKCYIRLIVCDASDYCKCLLLNCPMLQW